MEAFLAWLIASPIGEALIGAAFKRAMGALEEKITGLQNQIKSHEHIVNEMSKDMERFKKLTDQSSMKEQEEAADDVFRHM